MLELLLFALLGIAIGIGTGVTPGLHVNTVSLLLIALPLAPLLLAVLIISIAITHTFWDFVPSILLGAPSEDTALGVLPGHRMLLAGRGSEAIELTVAGGIVATLLALPALPLLLAGLPVLYAAVRPWIGLLLAGIAAFMILIERSWRQRLAAALVFGLAGVFGLIVLDSPLLPAQLVLFPVFTGLFGVSTQLLSLRGQSQIPEQASARPALRSRTVLSGSLKGLLSGAVMGTLPALGASQATVLTQHLGRGEQKPEEFLVSIGAINTIVSLFSLISLYTIARPRSGAAVAVQSVLGPIGFPELVLLVATGVLAAGLSAALLLKATPWLIRRLRAVPYQSLTKAIILFLVLLVGLFTGLAGLLTLATATAIGLLAPLLAVKRSLLMAVLMVPLIAFAAGA